MTKRNFAWLTINEDTDDDGFYLQGEAAYEAERTALKATGAPDTDEIEFISILPEDRDSAMAEANVTEPFIAWAKSKYEGMGKGTVGEPVANGDSNLVYYDNTDPNDGIHRSVTYFVENMKDDELIAAWEKETEIAEGTDNWEAVAQLETEVKRRNLWQP